MAQLFSQGTLVKKNTNGKEKQKQNKTKKIGSGGIRTHASEVTGALNQRLRPLGHATRWL